MAYKLATPIPSVGVFSDCSELKIVGVKDDERRGALIIDLCLISSGNIEYPDVQTISISDSKSNVLRVNTSATKLRDQFQILQADLPNNPYTELRAAWHSNTADDDKPAGRKKALLALLVSTGAIDSRFTKKTAAA